MRKTMVIELVRAFNGLDVLVARDEGLAGEAAGRVPPRARDPRAAVELLLELRAVGLAARRLPQSRGGISGGGSQERPIRAKRCVPDDVQVVHR